ncbi:MAG: aspartate--tRNA ligase [Candidatus Falkowbacteria bacterium]|nr:aspartate--tRNA ligase [Candidatus Falkowbacteria bacterium]
MKNNIIDCLTKVGQNINIYGWVNVRRDMGKVVFFDLRDRSGLIQIVVVPSLVDKKTNKILKDIRAEFLLEVVGSIQKRDKANPNLATGEIEILAKEIKIISASATSPLTISEDTSGINESLRLTYRYLDLRSERMKNNLKLRQVVNLFLRNYFSQLGFWEIETPYLTKGTPEGAREFIVPSRLHRGEFYVLPQSPQQFKQLLMVAGLEKYFQIVRCFRDEDQRGDRQPEFTQFDLEMSFAPQAEILDLMEAAMIALVKAVSPESIIKETPFPRFTYQEAVEKYKSDKPDLRTDAEKDDKTLAFCWVSDFPLFEKDSVDNKINAVHHPFTRPKTEDEKKLTSDPLAVRAEAYDLVLNGYEIGGGSLRIHERKLQEKVFKILGLKSKEINTRFGHLLEAFKYGPPPHGGIALGLDRLISCLLGEKNIREVMAFPKTSDAKDLLTGAPSPLPKQALKDVGIKINKTK